MPFFALFDYQLHKLRDQQAHNMFASRTCHAGPSQGPCLPTRPHHSCNRLSSFHDLKLFYPTDPVITKICHTLP